MQVHGYEYIKKEGNDLTHILSTYIKHVELGVFLNYWHMSLVKLVMVQAKS